MFKVIINLLMTIFILSYSYFSVAAEITFEQLVAAAEQGDLESQNSLGLLYFSGQKGKGKAYEAFKWFEKAANKGHATATYNLAFLYNTGQGTLQDVPKSKELFQKAADGGSPEAQFIVGTMHQERGEFKQAAKLIRMSAEKGNLEAQNRLGYFYSTGMGVPADNKLAHEWYLKAANSGYAKAQHNVGEDYFFGAGVEKNEQTAISWYKKAAAAGFSDSKIKLAGLAHKKGDTKESRKLLNEASKSGNNLAKDIISTLPADKSNSQTPQTPTEALETYTKKAKEGDRDAQFNLGMIYLRMGDKTAAIKWIEEAAAQGHPEAMALSAHNSGYTEKGNYAQKMYDKQAKDYEQQYKNRQNFQRDLMLLPNN